MSEVLEQAPIRGCYGCGQHDDHPRFTHVVDMADASKDQQYHYDCIPAGVREHHGIEDTSNPVHAIYIAATGSKNLKGDALRTFAGKHAESLVEAPADAQEG